MFHLTGILSSFSILANLSSDVSAASFFFFCLSTGILSFLRTHLIRSSFSYLAGLLFLSGFLFFLSLSLSFFFVKTFTSFLLPFQPSVTVLLSHFFLSNLSLLSASLSTFLFFCFVSISIKKSFFQMFTINAKRYYEASLGF